MLDCFTPISYLEIVFNKNMIIRQLHAKNRALKKQTRPLFWVIYCIILKKYNTHS